MKKKYIYFAIITVFIVIVGSIYIHFDRTNKSNNVVQINSKKRIVLLAHIKDNPYWQIVRRGAEDAAKERGCLLEYKGPKAASSKESLKLFDMAIAVKPDGIISYAQEDDAYIPLMQKAAYKIIPVITIDGDAKSSLRLAYVGTDNVQAGREAAKQMIEKTKGIGKIGIIIGGEGTINQVERIRGFTEYIENNSQMKIASIKSSDSYALEAELMTKKTFIEDPTVNCLFCTSALDGIGAAKAVKELDLINKVTIVAFDDLPETIDYIESGIIYATIVQKPYDMGYRSVNLMMDIFDGNYVSGNYLTGIEVYKKGSKINFDKEKRGRKIE
jgi:ribose transport system substrate-binding protein